MNTSQDTTNSYLFTTGCLHLTPSSYKEVTEKIVSELDRYRQEFPHRNESHVMGPVDVWPHGRFLVLAGDIIDPTPKYIDIYDHLSSRVRAAGFYLVWVAGNNDLWNRYPGVSLPINQEDRLWRLVGDMGVNWDATPWAHYHDAVSTDAANSYYGRALCGEIGGYLFAPDCVEAIVFHYPPFFADEMYKKYCPIEALRAPPMFEKLLAEMPRLKHIIVGHIHDQHEYIPRYIATENGVIKVTLATEKANGLITVVGEV